MFVKESLVFRVAMRRASHKNSSCGQRREKSKAAELLMRELETVAVVGEVHPPRDLFAGPPDVQVDERESEFEH